MGTFTVSEKKENVPIFSKTVNVPYFRLTSQIASVLSSTPGTIS
jgi:hypothetical protein